MATQTNNSTDSNAPANASTSVSKPKTVIEGLKSRSIFDSLDNATQFMQAQESNLSDWNDQTFVAPGMKIEGDDAKPVFDSVYHDPDYEIFVSKLMNKGDKKAGVDSSVKAVVMFPAPTLEALMESESGKAFVREIIRKEMNHRAVRPLRVVKNPEAAASEMPLSLESYITSQREAGGLLETFDSLYKKISDTLAAATKVWAKRKSMLRKAELRKAMESKAYALDIFPELEDTAKGSLFVVALQLGIKAAEREGLDPAIFNKWLETRDDFVIDTDDEDDTDDDADLELDSLLGNMLTDEATESSATDEATPGEQTEQPTEDQPAS